jgi:hypothetical protein
LKTPKTVSGMRWLAVGWLRRDRVKKLTKKITYCVF